ncbi:PQQ-dependent sugar dehydrogenase [Methylotenera sp.]|uniref:PQQ-dependent sugar dehydrogenase n=1 Tax=Methylotenera sp. TaxID=2051956 RepID=UPI00271D5E4B|nr:PQQ-dependent sugar dehydrogenase [Methylotenera sp.]MDO9206244.1 PQQ-dependent sugar dehydrogenase [Methylotenera sp.]
MARLMKEQKYILYGLVLLLALAGLATYRPLSAEQSKATTVTNVALKPIATGLVSPWSIAFLPDGKILVTEKPGRLRVIEHGKLLAAPVSGVPMLEELGQGGLLDVVLHPNYLKNGWLYLSYTAKDEQGVGVEVMRAKLKHHQLQQQEVIFTQRPKLQKDHHFGARIVFDQQGYLYITLGDRGEQERAQVVSHHIGKVIRLHDDGRIPKDNPVISPSEQATEAYTFGHRNVQGAVMNPSTGKIWTHEHGPQGGDEINILQAGVNYGWPVITYGVNYFIGTKIGEDTHKAGMAQPLYKWVPSIAPSGMAFYTGDAYPSWKGQLFIGSLKFQTLVKLKLDGDKVISEQRIFKNIGRVRDVRQGLDGLLYMVADDKVFQLKPTR